MRMLGWTVAWLAVTGMAFPLCAGAQNTTPSAKGKAANPPVASGAVYAVPEQALRRCKQKLTNDLWKNEFESRKAKGERGLPKAYREWVQEDAAYIIEPAEECAYLLMKTDEERDRFIEWFWLERNERWDPLGEIFKEEHYRRIAYVNEYFSTDVAGLKTDRGRIYVEFGPPDEIDIHPSDSKSWKPLEAEVKGTRFSWEEWKYRYVEGVGENVKLDFVDREGTGEFKLVIDAGLRKRLLRAQGLSGRRDDVGHESTRLEVGPWGYGLPPVWEKEMKTMEDWRIVSDAVEFSTRLNFAKGTEAATNMAVGVEIPAGQLTASKGGNESMAGYEIFGRIMREEGEEVSGFELAGNVKKSEAAAGEKSYRETEMPLSPGKYRLRLIVKDEASGRMGKTVAEVRVPGFEEKEKKGD